MVNLDSGRVFCTVQVQCHEVHTVHFQTPAGRLLSAEHVFGSASGHIFYSRVREAYNYRELSNYLLKSAYSMTIIMEFPFKGTVLDLFSIY